MGLVLAGLLLAWPGVLLMRRYAEAANRTGIGSFTLLPLAGLAYLLGFLLAATGGLLALLGLGSLW